MPTVLAWLVPFFLVAASADTKPDGFVISKPFLAGSTDPTAGSTAWALTSHGISEKLFTVDGDGQVVPQLAESIKKLSKFAWEVTIKTGHKFSDGTSMTAQHVAEALANLNTKNDGAQASLGSMTVTKLDDRRLTIVSDRATPVMDAVLAEWPFVVYLEKDGKKFFTGPYAVKEGGFVKDEQIELIPNEHYPRASERVPLVIKKITDGRAAASRLTTGELDMAFHLPVQTLNGLEEAGITTKSFEVGYQYMMWYNMAKPHFSDVKVRKAVDLAIDRVALTEEARGGHGTRSFFPKGTPYYLEEGEATADKTEAESLLDQAGWQKNADGIREKDGNPLTLKVVAYPQRPGLVTIQPVVKKNLEALGVVVNSVVTSPDNWDELDAIMAAKDFDLLMWAQHTLPAGDPQWFLNAFFASDAGNNIAGLNNTEVDKEIDDVSHADAATRVSVAAEAHRVIRQQVPVSILITPAWHVGLGSRLTSYEPYGSDYYVIHADFALPPIALPNDVSRGAQSSALGHLALAAMSASLCIGLLSM